MKTFAATALAAIAMAGKLQQTDAAQQNIQDDASYEFYQCVDLNGDGLLSFREMVQVLYKGVQHDKVPKEVLQSFRSNVYIHPLQFARVSMAPSKISASPSRSGPLSSTMPLLRF